MPWTYRWQTGSYPVTGFEEGAAISNGSGLLGVWPFAQRKRAEAELEIYQLKCHNRIGLDLVPGLCGW